MSELTVFKCDICRVSIEGHHLYVQHMSSKKHLKKLKTEGVDRESVGADSDVDDPKWTRDQEVKLVAQVMSQITKHDYTPFTFQNIDWDSIKFGPWSYEQCHDKWHNMTSTVRYYRTTHEVAMDALQQDSQSAKTLISKWNTEFVAPEETIPKKRMTKKAMKRQLNPQNNPDYPKKPSQSGYSFFSAKRLAEMTSPAFTVGKDRMLHVANEWKDADPAKKEEYTELWIKQKVDYLRKMERYVEDHPLDDTARMIVMNLKKPPVKKKKAQTSIVENDLSPSAEAGADSPSKRKKKKKLEPIEPPFPSLTSMSPPTSPIYTPIDTPTNSQSSADSKSPRKHKHRTGRSEEETTPKKQTPSEKLNVKQETASPKKSKPSRLVWTGKSLYVEVKKEVYGISHPDMDVEEVQRRLHKKFGKMSENKMEKYRKMAEEKNAA